VPSPDTVLTGLTAIANDWRWLAITWHALLAALAVMLIARWRPSTRLLGRLVVGPLLSVSVVAWLSGNPFNGLLFAILAVMLATTTLRPATPVLPAPSARVVAGVGLVVFGWTYPHFLSTDGWTTYLYASPFGILPCPTLSMVIGLTLIFENLGSTRWNGALVVAGLLYGAVGVFRLGVVLDWGLLLASAALAAAMAGGVTGWRSVHARSDRAAPAHATDGGDRTALRQTA
jgi:hypothetical protein